MNTRKVLKNFTNKFSDTFQLNSYYNKATKILSSDANDIRSYQKLHHNLCKLMFSEVKSGVELWIQLDELYPTKNNDSDENSKKYLRVSLITKSMLEYDQNMFNLVSSENEDYAFARSIFRPYFIHFLIDTTQINEQSKAFLSSPDILGQWFYGQISNEKCPGYMMYGLLETSASPVEYASNTLFITDHKLSDTDRDLINDVYTVRDDSSADMDLDINNYLDKIFNDTQFTQVRTYRVGDGNCIYLHGNSGKKSKRLLYDIGYHNRSHAPKFPARARYNRSVTAIRSMKPDCIILSHWDTDHIMGCTYAPQRIFDIIWIAPTCRTGCSVSAKRLCAYLDHCKRLMLVQRKPATIRTDAFARLFDSTTGSTISFWMGLGPHGGISAINGEGIIIEIENIISNGSTPVSVNTLLAGDVPYATIPNGVNLIKNASIDYLIVPHHGSKMDYNVLNKTASNPETCAIISASRSKLPNSDHVDALTDRDFKVYVTEDYDFFIDCNLLKINDVTF